MDIIVTTPKRESANAAKEAEEVIRAGGGSYFRYLSSFPSRLECGERVYYVEDGFVRGFCTVIGILRGESAMVCDTTGRVWKGKTRLCMDAESWKWIKPIPMQGCRGWRYADKLGDVEITGGWKDTRP